MPWRGPEFEGEVPSLGWGILEALAEYLPSPADQEKPLILTDEQARLLLRWYALEPHTGQFIYRRGCLEMAKGWGKSPFLGSLAIAELALPVLFDGWDANGEPVARPWGTGEEAPPWVQIAAVSEDQTDNTYVALYEMLTANDHKAARALGIDEGRTRLYLTGGRRGRLEPVTASAGSREGQRVTFGGLDETHLWLQRNRGHVLAKVLRRNVGKMNGRTFETTNAPELGENSVAEQTGKEAGKPGILYYARRAEVEPDPSWSDAKLRKLVAQVYGDATRWVPPDRIVKEIRDPATPWGDTLRFYLNIRVPGGGKAVDPRRWDELAKPHDIEPGTPIGIGFDGAISQDATVLRACTREGYSFSLGTWVRPYGPAGAGWTVPRQDVHEAVARAFELYPVGLMLADPPKWWTEIDEWARLYGDKVVLGLDTNQERRFAPAVDRWLTGIREGNHTHDADPIVSDHVRSACLRKAKVMADDNDQRTLYVLVKGEDGRRIDGAVADVLAFQAAMTMPDVYGQREPMIAFV